MYSFIDGFSNVLYSEDEQQYQHDLDVEFEPQEILDPYLASIPNHRP